ncbi:D-isomer specific 2-hydroxyacid dehydrogenase [Clostridium botulinum A1 str. CFSAN002368]|nr:D-isomer specific 2-hydroxyacid dehydrogenase [Clostridium botulinum A1 str. CFSAN002368]
MKGREVMEFSKIVCIDKTGLESWAIKELKNIL